MNKTISETRTYRRFKKNRPIESKVLQDLIELARLGGSARNCQPLQYLIINSDKLCANVFPHLGWAGYLPDWKGPGEDERPAAYILCYINNNWLKGPTREAYFDLGIASQNILLGATELGLGGCRIASFSKQLSTMFSFAEHLELCLVIALGEPIETVVLEECKGDNIKYWRDAEKVHHVPKRLLADVLLTYDKN